MLHRSIRRRAPTCHAGLPLGILGPILVSAADLLVSAEAPLVRECDGRDCSWLFIDRSRNHRRRWCDMASCGNRAKARRHYRRKKRAKQAVS